ncbi:hypothetical protein BJV77DRAFT_959967 [Russula vinacea]|nr:hypothetical protein BJV77DRAFT_959967 [Russula vinacea]
MIPVVSQHNLSGPKLRIRVESYYCNWIGSTDLVTTSATPATSQPATPLPSFSKPNRRAYTQISQMALPDPAVTRLAAPPMSVFLRPKSVRPMAASPRGRSPLRMAPPPWRALELPVFFAPSGRATLSLRRLSGMDPMSDLIWILGTYIGPAYSEYYSKPQTRSC